MNGRSFMDGLSLREREGERERKREKGKKRQKEIEERRRKEERERKRKKEKEREGRRRNREEEREGPEMGIEPSLCFPVVEIHQGSDKLGRTGDRDGCGVIHLDGRE